MTDRDDLERQDRPDGPDEPDGQRVKLAALVVAGVLLFS